MVSPEFELGRNDNMKSMRQCNLIAAIITLAFCGGCSPPEDATHSPSDRSTTRPSSQPRARLLSKAISAGVPTDLDKDYPGLTKALSDFPTQWAKIVEAKPGDPKLELLTVITPGSQPELMRILNFWNASREAFSRTVSFPQGTFDKVTTQPSSRPRGYARKIVYAVFKDLGHLRLLRFSRPEQGIMGKQWKDDYLTSFQGAARVGAAVALVQDALMGLRDKKGAGGFTTGANVVWPLESSVQWTLLQQVSGGEPINLYPLEGMCDGDGMNEVRLGAWVVDKRSKKSGLIVHLLRTQQDDKYLGWRISKFQVTDKPETEPPRRPKK